MPLKPKSCIATLALSLVFFIRVEAAPDDWRDLSVEVAGGGQLHFEFPEYWGKKPKLDMVEGIRTIRWGPYGPRRKPVFLVHLESVTTTEPVTPEAIKQVTESEVATFKTIAVETAIPINDIAGEHAAGHYFSITDRSSKIDEYDYLTLAILGADFVVIKCYFFSSDGAPDYGADALQMMQSLRYTPPPPEEEKKKKRR